MSKVEKVVTWHVDGRRFTSEQAAVRHAAVVEILHTIDPNKSYSDWEWREHLLIDKLMDKYSLSLWTDPV